MREIKFRAWDKAFLRMSSWEEIGLRDTEHFVGDAALHMLKTLFKALERETILMQFTGLHDKNGKEIYEGDIVRSPGGPIQGVIVYQAPSFVMKDKTKRGYSRVWTKSYLASGENQFRELIGNIYENPELLKV